MKAAVLVAQNEPLVVAEVDIPKLDVGQVLVDVAFSGICGKQLEEINGKRGGDPYIPHLMGHEGAGVVTEIGPGVRKVKPGDHVVLHWMKGSGIDSLPPRFNWEGTQVSAGWVTTFCEFTIASENRVTVIDNDMPLDAACLLGCAVTTGLGIILNNANVKPGESVGVFGAGGIGLNVIQGAALVNAAPIVAIDLFDHKLRWATDFGASQTLNSSQIDVPAALMDITNGHGFDVTVDTTGNKMVREIAFSITGHQGRTILAGVPQLDDQLQIDSMLLQHGQQIVGSHGGETQPDIDIPRYAYLYKLGKLNLDQQITHRFPIDDINEAVAKVQQGEVGRCLITM